VIKVGIFGASGRVGRLLIAALQDDKDVALSSVFVYDDTSLELPSGCIATKEYDIFLDSCDAVIDFSAPVATQMLLKELLVRPKAFVCGTTGLNDAQKTLLDEVSQKMPVLYATNMSLGVALLNRLVEMASSSLEGFDIEIVEMHHRHKKDAPSGTALTLAQSAASGRNLELQKVRVSGRDGDTGARTKDEIAVMALRGGDIFGRHMVGFYGDGEYVELGHVATSRETFAKGAIRAMKWLYGKPNGIYKITDSLGLR
jgi:4-hydroxy-tetrahydrodipicolinate reductase